MSNTDVTIRARRSKTLAQGKSFWQQWLPNLVISNGALAVVDQGIVSFANFVTNALVARACSKSDFGIYFMAISLLYFVRGFQEQLVSAPYTIYRHRRRGLALSRYTGHTLTHQCVLMIATLMGMGLFAFGVAHYLSPDHAIVRALVGLLFVTPFFLLREYIRKLTFANFEFRSALILDCVVASCQITAMVGLYWTSRLSIATAFTALAVASGVGGLGWLLLEFHRFSFRRSRLWSDWLENWSFGRWALATHLIGCSTPYVMPWFVASLRGEAVTGTLGACQNVVGMANMFVTGVSNFLSPRTAEAYAEGGTRALLAVQAKASLMFVISLGGFAIVMWGMGDILAHTIMGESYAGHGEIMVVLACALLANSLGMTAGNGIWAMNHPAHNLSADVTSLVVTFGVATYLVPSLGALGAAWSAAIGHTCSALQRWLTFGRLVRLAQLRERENEPIATSQ